MKRSFIIFMSLTFIAVLLTATPVFAAEQKSEPSKIQGTIKEKLEKPDRIILAAPNDNNEFLYAHVTKEGCVPWKDLKVGDNVEVTYKEKKTEKKNAPFEVICIKYIRTGTTLQGGSLHGGSIQ